MFYLKRYIFVFMFLFLLVTSGCRSSGIIYHINENVDFSFIKRVAVMPMDNLTNEKSANEIVRHVVISELLASGLVEVVVPGEVMYAINRLNIKNISSHCCKNTTNKIIEVDAVNQTIRTQSGATLQELVDAGKPHGLWFPVLPESKWSCTIASAIA